MARLDLHIPVRWGDLDPYGHVNNVAMMRLLEEARIAAFWRRQSDQSAGVTEETHDHTAILGAGADGSTLTFVARNEIEYLAPMGHVAQPAHIQLWISTIGGASIDIDYEVYADEQLCAIARTVLVMIDPQTTRPRRITDVERETWAHVIDTPLQFRR